MLFNYIAVLTKEKALIYSGKLCDERLFLIHTEHGNNVWKRHERVIYYFIMGYLMKLWQTNWYFF